VTTTHHPENDPADHARSGDDVLDAVRVAEQGTGIDEVHGLPGAPGSAPVEQVRDDPEMTEGQVVLGEGEPGRHRAVGTDPEGGSSGAAQSVRGARPIDQT
jgi:hypothetical protein